GGFLEVGETAEAGQLRELHEELGISADDISPLTYITTSTALYTQSGETRPLLCILYWATLREGVSIAPADDVASCKEFAIADVPLDEFAGEDNRQAFIELRKQLAKSNQEV